MNALVPLFASAAHEAPAHLEPLVGTRLGWMWLIPALPLLGAAINLAIGARLQKAGRKNVASTIAVGAMVLATLLAWYIFLGRLLPLEESQRYLHDHVWSMFTAGSLQVDLAFSLDPLSMLMVLIITTIGTAIHVYSVGYMDEDPSYWKFFVYLNYFVFSMLLLVMGENFFVMFFGWEGVGLASYLLIGFWYTDVEKAKAGMKAFVVNRFGDFGFLLGLFILFWSLGGAWVAKDYVADQDLRPMRLAASSVTDGATAPASMTIRGEEVKLGPTISFRELRNQVVLEETGVAHRLSGLTLWGLPVLFLVGIFMFVGATGKSAQIPLYVWLPDAMAGPTPVSALIHAATMVTAGVYMIARLNFLYALSPGAMTVVAMVGAATALFAATIGFFQHDIKKVLAYSTVSQLGFMFMGVGVGAFWVGVYHLMNHAAFKATLFLGSGSVIHGCHHEQDMRKMGGLRKYMPVTHWTYLIATFAITGLPIANGFYSKDEILWLSLAGRNLAVPGWLPWALGFVAAMGTAYYMWRSYFFTFFGTYRGEGHGHDTDDHTAVTHDAAHAALDADEGHGAGALAHHDDHGHHGLPHESPKSMTGVLVFLASLSVVTLFLGLPHSWGFVPLLERWLHPVMVGSTPLMRFDAFPPHYWLEYALQVVGGLGLPILGAAVAWWFYVGRGTRTRDRLAEETGWWTPVWRAVYNKYYVDEAYQAVVIRPALAVARAASWFDQKIIDGLVNLIGLVSRLFFEIMGGLDKNLIDGLVTGVGASALRAGRDLKRIQARTIRTYLYAVVGGALVIVLINYVLLAQ